MRLRRGGGRERAENLFSPRPPEGTRAQIEKDGHQRGENQELRAIFDLCPTVPHAPEAPGKDQHKEKEKNARHFQPHEATHTAEGAQEAAHATRNAPCRPSGRCSANSSAGDGLRRGRGSSGLRSCILRAGGHALPDNASGNPQPDTEDAANLLSFHSDYDGSSDNQGRLFL